MKPTAFFSPDLHPGRVSGIAKPLPEDVASGVLCGIQAVVLHELLQGPRNTGQLMEAVYNYGQCEPNTGRHSLYNAISKLRERLKPGWRIEHVPDPHHPRWYRHYVLRRV